MKTTIRCAIALLAVLVWTSTPSPARAEEPASPDATVYEFDDDLVQGDTLSPALEVLTVRSRKGRQSLVRARESFVIELLQSVEQL